VQVLAEFGDEPQPLAEEEPLSEGYGDIAFVAKELPKEPTDQAWNRSSIVETAGSEADGEQLATVIDHQMELEPIEPSVRCEEGWKLRRVSR
jgi:hypothetical protein